jgi:hypothetical protein
MQHDRRTGKLDMRSKEVLRDPASVKRLLEAAMIYPDGKLTPEAWKKCAVLAEKLKGDGALFSADSKPAGDKAPAAPVGKKAVEVSAEHWAVLMKYDRKTGNLLRIDPKTGQLDNASRSILKNPSVIQRLVDENMILPGGWLTPEAKQGCDRIEKKIRSRVLGDHSVPANRPVRKSKDEPKPEIKPGRKSKNDRGLKVFFENLPRDVMIAAAGSGISLAGDRQDLQAFFENLPDDVPGPDPETFFSYDWKDERDLQAYYENLPQDFPESPNTKNPGEESTPSGGRRTGNKRKKE